MMQKLIFFSALFIFIIFNFNGLHAQIPKHEMRAVWFTTAWGLDWPKTKIPDGGSETAINQQKESLIKLLDSMKEAGLNAVFFQVRPEADAFYKSSYEPWSEHLVATRGSDPGYDPLQFAIEECHKRGLELHAWLNPYRFESVAGKYSGREGNYNESNPEWVLTYDGKESILDPGNPAVRQRISDIVEEIVINYDVDGIVFDDYFYAYGGTPANLDTYSQKNWKPAEMNLHNWRRSNINQMIAGVYQSIKNTKPWVRFGVSPFGIWTTDAGVAASYNISLPQGITGMDAYHTIYADALAWLQEGTVDYISPQLYWPTTSTGQDYKKLAPWWSEVANHFGRHLYVSHSLSELDESDYPPPVALKSAYSNFLRTELQGMSMIEYFSRLGTNKLAAGFDASEIGEQIYWNRISDKNQAPGSVFFRASMFSKSGFINYLLTHEYENKALPPVLPREHVAAKELPHGLQVNNNLLSWESSEENVRFAVYAIPELMINQPGIFRDAAFLLGLSYTTEFDVSGYSDLAGNPVFAVAVVDRYGNEFPPVIMGKEANENQPVDLLLPSGDAIVFPGFSFSWEAVEEADHYLLEVAADPEFKEIIARRTVTETRFSSSDLNLEEDRVYYWRVLTRMANTADALSEVRTLTVRPLPRPVIEYPLDGQSEVELTPEIRWEAFDPGFDFRIQISKSANFTGLLFDEADIEGTSFALSPGIIQGFSTYYLRMQAVSEDSVTLWSETVKFSTVNIAPSVPVIVTPQNGESVTGPGITIEAEADLYAKSFTFQLSQTESFPWTDRQQVSVDAPETSIAFEDLEPGTWYVKARAGYGTSQYTSWSETVMFSILTTGNSITGSAVFSLEQPVFSTPETLHISYTLARPSRVQIYITGLTGKRMAIVTRQQQIQGKHILNYNAGDLVAGIYLITLETDFGRKTVKLIKSK